MNEKQKTEGLLIFGPVLTSSGILGLTLTVSTAIPQMTLDVATNVLVNTIQLDGLLFGFTAVMYGLFYGRRILKEKTIKLSFLMITSFLCYYFSLALAFFLLGTQATDGLILGPALTSVVGGFLASVMVIITLIEQENKSQVVEQKKEKEK